MILANAALYMNAPHTRKLRLDRHEGLEHQKPNLITQDTETHMQRVYRVCSSSHTRRVGRLMVLIESIVVRALWIGTNAGYASSVCGRRGRTASAKDGARKRFAACSIGVAH